MAIKIQSNSPTLDRKRGLELSAGTKTLSDELTEAS